MITIRELNLEDDLNAVLKLCKDFFDEYEDHHEEFFDTDNLCDDDISGRFLESLESDANATIVALKDEKIIGYASIAVSEQPRFYKIKKVGSISALMVAKGFRRKGVASLLIEKSKEFFKSKEIKYFTLYTSHANVTAIKLYKKIGLEKLHESFLGEV